MKRNRSSFQISLSQLMFALFLMLGSFSFSAQAVLIDNGGSTLDDSTGLEWLDLTSTNGLTIAQALSAFSGVGYGYATDTQVSGLLAAFNIIYQFIDGTYVDLGAAESDRQNFISLFGATGTNQSLGYFDVSGDNAYLCLAVAGACGPLSFVNDTDQYIGNNNIGIFLVRGGEQNRSIPAPTTLALLGLGLAGLGYTRRKKI